MVHFQQHKRRKEIAQLLEALLEKRPSGTIYVAWDNATTHEDDEVEEVVRAAAGRLVLLYLPAYSPWLNPIEMLWRHCRREVTHGELFETKQAPLAAARGFFDRYNRCPHKILSVIGSPAAKVARMYLGDWECHQNKANDLLCQGVGEGVGVGEGEGEGEGVGVGVGVGEGVALATTGYVTTGVGLPDLWVVGVGSGPGLTDCVAEGLATNRVGEGVNDNWLPSRGANADA